MGLFSGAKKQFTMPPEPDFAVVHIPAADVEPGMTVTAIGAGTWEVQELWPGDDGCWPAVTGAEYDEFGEHGEPLVYLTLDDDPDACHPCRPGDLIAVAAEAETENEPWDGR